MLTQLTNKPAQDFANQVGEPFQKAPHLPQGILDFLVGIAHWLVGLGGALTLLGALQTLMVAIGISQAGHFFDLFVVINPVYWWISSLISLASGALMLMAFKPLQNREFTGWMYLFWVQMLMIAEMLVGVIFVGSSIVGLVIGTLIGLYMLYEFKPYYHSNSVVARADKTATAIKKTKSKKSN